MKLQIILGKIVLFMIGLWVVICGALLVADLIGTLVGFPIIPSMTTAMTLTLTFLTFVGLIYSTSKLGKLIDAKDEKDERSNPAAG